MLKPAEDDAPKAQRSGGRRLAGTSRSTCNRGYPQQPRFCQLSIRSIASGPLHSLLFQPFLAVSRSGSKIVFDAAVAIVLSDRGSLVMDEIRILCAEMETVAHTRLAQQTEAARSTADRDQQVAHSGEPLEAEEIIRVNDDDRTYISVTFPIRNAGGNGLRPQNQQLPELPDTLRSVPLIASKPCTAAISSVGVNGFLRKERFSTSS